MTGGLGLGFLPSLVPKTIKLTTRAPGNAAPLVARRIESIPFIFSELCFLIFRFYKL